MKWQQKVLEKILYLNAQNAKTEIIKHKKIKETIQID